MNTTCFPENFFSSSLTNLVWIFWKDFSCGTGTKITIAFFPPEQSTWSIKQYQTCNRIIRIWGYRLLLQKLKGELICANNLLSSSDVELPQLSLQVGVDLQVEQGLADALLDLVGLLIVHLDDLSPSYASHSDF